MDVPSQQSSLRLLSEAEVGDRLWIAGYQSKDGTNRLIGMGLAPGMEIRVLQNLAGSWLVGIGESRLGIDGTVARSIRVSQHPFDGVANLQEANMNHHAVALRDLQVNQQGKVCRYQTTDNRSQKAYKKKLLAMGLTPGTEFTVTRVAPLGDPIEILVRGFKLSLRKDEAAALIVETVVETQTKEK